MFMILKRATWVAFVTALICSSSSALASGYSTFHVTITNITNAINFTPILVASHRRPVTIFELGSPASDDLTAIAEGGDVVPMTITLNANRRVVDVQNSGDLLKPGKSVTVVVSAARGARYISIASMMLPTNDGFIALDSVKVPWYGSATYFSSGYDAGTELNDESCRHIPGPTCISGVGPSPGENPGDEKFVHIHRGMHGIGSGDPELKADVYDWRNPVAKITVKRVRGH